MKTVGKICSWHPLWFHIFFSWCIGAFMILHVYLTKLVSLNALLLSFIPAILTLKFLGYFRGFIYLGILSSWFIFLTFPTFLFDLENTFSSFVAQLCHDCPHEKFPQLHSKVRINDSLFCASFLPFLLLYHIPTMNLFYDNNHIWLPSVQLTPGV